jgi:hypothetical protein
MGLLYDITILRNKVFEKEAATCKLRAVGEDKYMQNFDAEVS